MRSEHEDSPSPNQDRSLAATTIFTWGYFGWGNATASLVEAIDAVEAGRGFEPPVFVDIRIRRSVRAKGFQGNNFEKLIGPTRYRWMKSLGNRYIETRTGPQVQIAEPSAAAELLAFALECASSKQRILFFCSCQWPRCDGQIACHRATVAELLLQATERIGSKAAAPLIEIVEWPGGEPARIDLDVPAQVYHALRRRRMTVPLGSHPKLAVFGGLPWCSIATLRAENSSEQELYRIVGPAIRQPDQWVLPVLGGFADRAGTLAACEEEAGKLRLDLGLIPATLW
jgi:hypothetical protein